MTDGDVTGEPGAPGDLLAAGSALLFEANPLAMWVNDPQTLRILAANEAAVRQYGWPRHRLLSMTVLDLLPPDDRTAAMEELLAGGPADTGAAGAGRRRHYTCDGTVLNVEVETSPVGVAGRPATLVLVRDVTEQDRLRDELETTGDQLREAEAVAKVGIWEWDVATDEVRWSDELYRIFGLSPQAFPSTFEGYIAAVHPEDRVLVEAAIERSLRSLEPFDLSHRCLLPGGAVRWLQCRGRVRSVDGQPVLMTGVAQDVTAQREAAEALSQLALHDPLTELPNRSLFMDRLGQALRRLDRRDRVLAVLFVDLDRFKTINDRFGHATGDEILVAVGTHLREVLRPHDTVARLGGDEFVVLCEDLEDDGAAVRVAERVLTALDRPIVTAGEQKLTCSASIGIALTRRSDVTPDALLRDADMAMYRAKETGRNRIEVFDHSARLRTQARIQTAEELRYAVDSDQLRVVYQPIVHLGQATPSGVEALVRWQHPRRGLLAPAEFIQVAEDTGLVVPLGAWVLRQACRDLTEILDRNAIGADSDLVMSVNLSARQLNMPSLVPMVDRILTEFGLPPWRLCFEITESILMDDVDGAIPVLTELRALGVKLAIDDFGTGYSSLGYLRRFPVDIVKLDRSFVGGLGTDSAADAITAAVINLGHALGLTVIAEGVENEEQLTVLRALRCDRAQGYLWSTPQGPAPLAEWMAAKPSGRLEPEPVDLAGLVAERVQEARPASTGPIVTQVPPTLAPAFADAGAVRKVLDHLLHNALKYSHHDRPVVVSAAADRRFVRVSVADYGIGMTADEAARCFEPFWQAEQLPGAYPRTLGLAGPDPAGAGVGLYIVRSLVEAMGGQVAVRSARGAGSTFTFALPRSAREAQRAGRQGALPPGMGEASSIREFMRQIGVIRGGRVPPSEGAPVNRGRPSTARHRRSGGNRS